MNPMETPRKHSMIWTLLTSLLVLMLLIGYSLYASWSEAHDRKISLLGRIARQNEIIDSKAQIEESLDAVKQEIDQLHYLCNSETEAIASAEMQNLTKSIVTDAGGELTTTQGGSSKVQNGFVMIPVKFRVLTSFETFRAILYQFENNVPILLVDEIDITPVMPTRNPFTKRIEREGQLNIGFTVMCFMRADKK